MATFTSESAGSFNTALPNIQVYDDKPNNVVANTLIGMAPMGMALAEKGITKHYTNKAEEDMKRVTKEFSDNLQQAEELGTQGEFLNKSFEALAAQDPAIRELKGKLGSFNTVEQQRAGASILFQIKAEAELKKAIRRAPGLRSEIAAAATETLGFNPSGSMINMLLKGIDSDLQDLSKGGMTDKQKGDISVNNRLISEYDVAPIYNPDGTSDSQTNIAMLNQLGENKRQLEHDKSLREKGIITEQDMIYNEANRIGNVYSMQIDGLVAAAVNVQPDIDQEAEYEAYSNQALPALRALRTQMVQDYKRRLGYLANTAEGSKYADSIIEQKVDGFFGGLIQLAEGGDMSAYNQRMQTYSVMKEQYNMSFAESNQVLTVLQDSFPQLINTIASIAIVNEPDTFDRVSNQLMQALNMTSPEQLKAMDLKSFTKVVSSDSAFDRMSEEEKLSASRTTFKVLDKEMKQFNPKQYSYMDYDSLSRMFANAFGTTAYHDEETVVNFTDLLVSGNLPKMIDGIEKEATDGGVKAGILADSANEYMLDAVRTEIVPDISQRALDKQNITLNYNQDTGHMDLVYKNSTSKRRYDRVTPAVARFNNAIDTMYELRGYSESTKDMSKAEISQLFFRDVVRRSGIPLIGTPTEVRMPQQKAVTDTVDTTDLIYSITERARQLSSNL